MACADVSNEEQSPFVFAATFEERVLHWLLLNHFDTVTLQVTNQLCDGDENDESVDILHITLPVDLINLMEFDMEIGHFLVGLLSYSFCPIVCCHSVFFSLLLIVLSVCLSNNIVEQLCQWQRSNS